MNREIMSLTKFYALSSVHRYSLGIVSLFGLPGNLPRQLVDRLKNGFGLPIDNC